MSLATRRSHALLRRGGRAGAVGGPNTRPPSLPSDRRTRPGRHRRVLHDGLRGDGPRAGARSAINGGPGNQPGAGDIMMHPRILIVDDDQNVCETFAAALTHEGYHVRFATS